MTTPSILIVDDGELDRVQSLVGRLAVDWMRCAAPKTGVPLEKPRDLLITSGPRAMKLPPLVGESEPVWLCIYDQDFLPLRERLRELGVHYLVSGELAPRTFLLFLRQILYRGEERRQVRRIPLQCEIEIHFQGERRKGLLLELSRGSCVFAGDEPIPAGGRVSLRLPPQLCGEPALMLSGAVQRSSRCTGPPIEHGAIGVLRFESLDVDATARIHEILSGHALGTQVTPLRDEPEALRTEPDWALDEHPVAHAWTRAQEDRRDAHRHYYGRRVEAIRWIEGHGIYPALGRDLSLSGVRVSASELPDVGAEVTLALYGRDREEPLLVDASVVRVAGHDAGLRFERLGPNQLRGLRGLLAASPCVEDLDLDDEAGSVHVVELLRPWEEPSR